MNVARVATQLRAKANASSVMPNSKSLATQLDIGKQFFRHLELVGDYHTHPYPSLAKLRKVRGWEYSHADSRSLPFFVEEELNPEQVRSSIARRLGLDVGGAEPADRDVEGVVEMMLDATQNFAKPLTEDRLLAWHAALFPAGRSGMRRIIVGAGRDDAAGPMQVVSGPIGREKVHYEAPAAPLLSEEVARFLAWANEKDGTNGLLRAGLAHLWFVTVHPFDDGNGRVARAIADWQLARSENSAHRFYSMSAAIRHQRNDYYDTLERTQKGTLDVTPWLAWFLGCLERAFDGTETTLAAVLRKERFWERAARFTINDRQRLRTPSRMPPSCAICRLRGVDRLRHVATAFERLQHSTTPWPGLSRPWRVSAVSG